MNCENIERIGGATESSDQSEHLEPTDDDDPLTSESEQDDDASDVEEEDLDMD